MHHMGDAPTSFPEEFNLSEDSDEIEIEYFGRVLRVQEESAQEERVQEESFQEFWIGDDSDEGQESEQDTLQQWYEQDEQAHYVRMIQVEN